jgi:putative DNA primase/helicase
MATVSSLQERVDVAPMLTAADFANEDGAGKPPRRRAGAQDTGHRQSPKTIVRDKREGEAQFPAGFAMTSQGLTFSTDEDVRVLSGVFEVLAETRDRHNQEWGVLLRWRDRDGREHQFSVARSLLAGDAREVRQALLSGGLHISPVMKDRNLFSLFLSLVRIDRRARAVSRIGWQDDAFALPDRTIDAGGGELVVYQGAAALDHEFREAGTLEDWQAMARLAAGNARVAVAICAAFVGPLLAATGSEGGGLHLRGESSIGKTTCLLAGASVWGPPIPFMRQWRATQNGLEGVAELRNHSLLVLDEIAQLDPRDAGTVAYMLANGTGKSRASQTGEARAAKRWLVFFLSSGEVSLAEHARSDGRGRRSPAGQEVRILDIEADAGKGLGLFEDLHGFDSGDALARAIKDGAEQHHGVAGPAFVRALLGNLDTEAKLIKVGIDRFVADYLPENATAQVVRACRRFGLIAMAGECAVHLGVLPWAKGEAVAATAAIFASWVEARGGSGAAEDRAAIEQVAEFVVSHGNSRFQVISESDGSESAVIYNRAGWKRETADGETEYLFPVATWNEVCRGLTPKAVAALLIARGHLVPGADGKASTLITIPGIGRARFYVVKQSICGDVDA